MHITVGILAYNESEMIETMLASLLNQTVFSLDNAPFKWHIQVIPNGCKDNTAELARNFLSNKVPFLTNKNVTFDVIEIAKPGKSNAWNQFVHEISPSDTDVFLFLDSDIEFGQIETISNCLNLLMDSAENIIVIDKALKKFPENSSYLTRYISSKTSSNVYTDPTGIAGSFYIARQSVIKKIWMPVGLSGEDGFLYTMAITDCFRKQADTQLVKRAKNSSHYFEGLTSLKAIIQHEVRLVIGTTLNCYLTWDSLYQLTDPNGGGAGEMIRDLNKNKPDWYAQFVENTIKNRGFWVLPRGMFSRRLSMLKGLSFTNQLIKLPLFIIAFMFDLIAMIIANKKLKQGNVIGYW